MAAAAAPAGVGVDPAAVADDVTVGAALLGEEGGSGRIRKRMG